MPHHDNGETGESLPVRQAGLRLVKLINLIKTKGRFIISLI